MAVGVKQIKIVIKGVYISEIAKKTTTVELVIPSLIKDTR